MIEKGLISPKPIIKQLALDILYLLFERDLKSALYEQIQLATTQKNPKIVLSALTLIIDLLTTYGVKKMDLMKPFWNTLEQLA